MAGTRADALMVDLPDGERKASAKRACEVAGVDAGYRRTTRKTERVSITPGHNRFTGHNRFIGRDPKIKSSSVWLRVYGSAGKRKRASPVKSHHA
jgi:hypothetical protein